MINPIATYTLVYNLYIATEYDTTTINLPCGTKGLAPMESSDCGLDVTEYIFVLTFNYVV